MNRLFLIIMLFIASMQTVTAVEQNLVDNISHQEKLRGSITPERSWWDLTHYHLAFHVDITNKSLAGSNTVSYIVLSESKELQIELQPPMVLEEAIQNGKRLSVRKDGYSYFISLEETQLIGVEYQLTLSFSGHPKVAINPPWDGGITWDTDNNGNPFIASSNQGIGASIWWPNKDHGYDEPDKGIVISVEVPEHLVNVSNGRLINIESHNTRSTKTYHWQVNSHINNYGVNFNIADYVHFSEEYQGENGLLSMDYYVLRDNLEKAKKQFSDAKRTLEALEYWFGPYPFYQDGYKLVEVPYLGMEHQSSVTYGNGYQNGYKGRDLSQTGWGLTFDFIIIHESGHEWFANNITAADSADLWIHESFTNYSEALFLEYFNGKEAANEYLRGWRATIKNDMPIIGEYNANREGSSDMYPKGANMLHVIRQLVDNDEKWRETLRGLNKAFFHQTVTSEQVESYLSEHLGRDLTAVFDQYLRDDRLPILEYFIKDQAVKVRWSNCREDFTMPLKVTINDKEQWITPNTKWQSIEIDKKIATFVIDKNFYVASLNVLGN